MSQLPSVEREVQVQGTTTSILREGVRLIPAAPRFEYLLLEFFERMEIIGPNRCLIREEKKVFTCGWPTNKSVLKGLMDSENLTETYQPLVEQVDMLARAEALDSPDMIAFINGKT